ncbi:MAG: radical SAM protein [Pseudomonadales bacterium]
MSLSESEATAVAASAPRKQRPYLFYGQTTSLCEECLDTVPAKIIFSDDCVYYLKRCPEHGAQKTLISVDIPYFLRTKEYLKPGDMPHKFQTAINRGCPHDCGLCPDHEQHSCLAIFDIIDECNLKCPVCYANSEPGRGNAKSMEQIDAMLQTLLDSEMEPDLVQLSGGEPTLHPQFEEILSRLHASPVRHVMVNTNGVRLANEIDFVARLAEYRQGFEVYLQFDSLEAAALKRLRGIDARSVRQRALAHLEAHNISTTLVCTIELGTNDHEIDAIIKAAQSYRCVRGITFQPIQDAGRVEEFGKKQRYTLSHIRRAIVDGDNPFGDADMVPLPCHPENISIGYALRNHGETAAQDTLIPVSGAISKEMLLSGSENSITFEKNETLKAAFMRAYSLDACTDAAEEKLHELLCCLPRFEAPGLDYGDVFRVVIMSFMDAYDFCISSVKRSCVHFVTPEGKIYPFDTYNLFYRDQRVGLVNAD